jgi:lysophospholipase L1-like esterase
MESNRKAFKSGTAAWLRAAAFAMMAANAALPATAQTRWDDHEASYLALGDSVAFGYITADGYAYVNAENFIGYPFWLAATMHMVSANAACPGETSGSFLSSTAPDNGCRAFRSQAPLHVKYTGTQLAFATSYLSTHRNTRLVTIGLGANDIFLLEDSCGGNITCIENGLPAVLASIVVNMETIIADLLATGYSGKIVVVNYYSTDYTDTTTTDIVTALNGALATAANAFGLPVSDSFTAFQNASIPAGGQTCVAGLLNVDPANNALCDVHPAQSGQRLLARTLRSVL